MYRESELKDYEMIQLAHKWHEEHGTLSVPFLQRKLQVNYTMASKILETVKKELINKRLLD